MADRGDVDEFGRQRGGRRSRSRSPDSDEDFRRRGTNRAPPSSAPATARPGTLKRGRSRSPPGGGRSPPRGRRRSPTPPSKRRRPDEYDRRRSEPARGGRSAPLSATTLQQHRTRLEGPLMTFKEFALTEPDDVDPSTSITSYEKYKTDYHAKHAQTFFQARKGEQWFLDRYDRTRLASAYITPSEFQTQTLTRYTSFVSQYKSTEVNFLTQNIDLHQNIAGVDVERKERFVDNCIQVVGLPSRITKEALVQLFSSVAGFSHLYLSPIDTINNKFQRTAYVFYTSQEQTSKAFDQYDFYKLVMTPNKSNNVEGETESKTTTIPKLNGALQPIVLRLRPNPSRISHHLAPFITMEERIQRDLEQATQLAKVLDKERSIEENVIFQDGTIHGLTPTLKQLNLVLYYLRSVHHYCYYCHQQYYSTESMFHACGMIHDRDTKGPSTDADQEFVTSLDNAIAERLITTPEFPSPPPPVDQAIVEKHVEEYYNNTIKKKAENKFKCNSCAKMFKSAEFVRKHIAGKHQNEIAQAEAKAHEEMMYDLYMADEHRPSDIVTSTGVTKRSRSRSPRRRSPSRSRSRSRERRPRSRSRSPYYERHGVPVIDSGLLPPTSIVPAPPGAPLLPTPQGYYPPPPPHVPYGGQYGPPMMPPHVPPPHHMQHHPPPHHMPPPPHMHPHHPPPPPPHMMRPPPPPPAMTRLAPDPVAAGRRIKSYSDLDAPKENDFVPDYGAFPKKKTTFASLSKWTKKTPTKQNSTDGTTTTTTENNQENDSNKTEDQEMTS